MNRGMFVIWEEPAFLCDLMRRQSDSLLHTRLHMLYLLRIGAATNRQQLARLLGVSRKIVGQWLARYERGGLPALLRRAYAPGKTSSLPPAIMAAMKVKLSDPQGMPSFQALYQWVVENYQISTTYRVVYYAARHLLGARLAVARPTHRKKRVVRKLSFALLLSNAYGTRHSGRKLSDGRMNCCL